MKTFNSNCLMIVVRVETPIQFIKDGFFVVSVITLCFDTVTLYIDLSIHVLFSIPQSYSLLIV